MKYLKLKFKKSMLVLTVIFTFPSITFAEGHNVLEFDIAGVKLGMSQEEAIYNFTKYLGIDKAALKIKKPTLAKYGNPATGKPYSEEFSYDTKSDSKGDSYVIYFQPNVIDPDRANSVVSEIYYGVPYVFENKQLLRDSVISKYGEPSYHYEGGMGFYTTKWCELETVKMKGFSSYITQCTKDKPFMELEDLNLQLITKKYSKALDEYRNKQKQAGLRF